MSFSYDPELATALDRIRHLVGDTVAPGLRSDETIEALLLQMTEAEATATVAESLASEFALQPTSVSIPGGPSVSYSDRVKQLFELAKKIRGDITSSAVQQALYTLRPTRYDDDPEYLHSEYGRPHPDIYYPSPDPWFDRGPWT